LADSFSPQFVRVKNENDKCRRYKDDHFVLCSHCLPVTVCFTFPLPESGFDREKREKGKNITIWPIFNKRNRLEM
jgi:hypothetical protein